jgi:hypothetical protein
MSSRSGPNFVAIVSGSRPAMSELVFQPIALVLFAGSCPLRTILGDVIRLAQPAAGSREQWRLIRAVCPLCVILYPLIEQTPTPIARIVPGPHS